MTQSHIIQLYTEVVHHPIQEWPGSNYCGSCSTTRIYRSSAMSQNGGSFDQHTTVALCTRNPLTRRDDQFVSPRPYPHELYVVLE